ncbi:MAG: hypothetical protein A2148_05795 [Chloroflexi bacterium RBG_16_68_14]|nr:MAG: hypothetical protein A2148_05795 [Chloroflexi bacterium RBG_16_68_14]
MLIEQRVPLRQRRDLSQIIEASLNLYLRNFWPFFSIAAIVIPLGVASAAFQSAIDDRAALTAIVLPLALLQAAANLLAVAALIAALADLDAGRRAEFSRSYDVAFERFWTLAGAILRVAAIVLLLFVTVLGIPWAIQRAVRWLFVEQAVILDGTSAKEALGVSADAVIGQWWRTLGISLVIGAIGGVPASIVGGLFYLAPVLVSGTANAVVNAALLPFGVTAMTLLYLDLKVRKESAAAGL